MAVNPIPEGYHSVTPYLVVKGVAELLTFLQNAFGAMVQDRHDAPDGSVVHAAVRLGDSMLMLAEAQEDRFPAQPSILYHYVPDCDATFEKALEAGAEVVIEPSDMFYGDRHGGIKDPSGNTWWIATHVEDLTPEEIQQRAMAMGQ